MPPARAPPRFGIVPSRGGAGPPARPESARRGQVTLWPVHAPQTGSANTEKGSQDNLATPTRPPLTHALMHTAAPSERERGSS